MMAQFFGYLRTEKVMDQRVALWKWIMGTRCVPLVSPAMEQVVLEGYGEARVYLLDLECLSPEQWERLVAYLATRFERTVDEVVETLRRDGCPVLADDVIVSFFGVN